MIARFLFVTGISLILFSCSEGRTSVRDAVAAPSEVESGQDRIGAVEASILETRTKKTKHRNKISAENYGNKRFLASVSGSPVFPEDFIIGALFSDPERSGTPEDIITKFFEVLKKNELDEKSAEIFFTKENRVFLHRIFSEWIEEKLIPDKIRMANARSNKAEEATVNIRGFKGEGGMKGEFFMKRADGMWKIDGFSGDFCDLKEIAERSEILFEPELYTFF